MNANHRLPSSTSSRRTAAALVSVLLIAAWHLPASAAEHPKEHPKGSAQSTATQSNVTLDDVTAYVERYVKDNSTGGVFSVTDDVANKKLSLTLDKVHRERLSQVGPDMYFVCADFKTTDGSKIYDIDLFVQGTSKDALTVVPGKTTVHKEDGKERYTWALNEQTGNWEQKPVGAASTPESGKKAEHPEHPKKP